jgi:hypothetical protein
MLGGLLNNEWGNVVEGSGRGLIGGTISEFALKNIKRQKKKKDLPNSEDL